MSATDTKFGESAQALFCAIADIVGLSKAPKVLDLTKYTNYNEFEAANRKLIDQAYKAIDTPGASLQGIEDFLNSVGHNVNNCEWMVHSDSNIVSRKAQWTRFTN